VHRLVETAVPRELGHLERVAGVREGIRWVEREPGGLDDLLRVPVDAGPVALLERGARNPFGRVLRVEIEREPLDLGAEPALQPLGPREADVAEGSGVVAPDEDRELVHGLTVLCSAPAQPASCARAQASKGSPVTV